MSGQNDAIDFAALMQATQAGDQDAYRRLLEAVQPMLHRYVRRRISSPEATEDICQDALLTVHRVRHTFEAGRPFEPWFYAIARSRLIDHVRRAKRIGLHEVQSETLPETASDQDLPGWDRFLEVLEALPPAQREAFSLLKIDGLSTAEAAEKVGVSVSALKVRAHRAYKSVRRAVLEDGD